MDKRRDGHAQDASKKQIKWKRRKTRTNVNVLMRKIYLVSEGRMRTNEARSSSDKSFKKEERECFYSMRDEKQKVDVIHGQNT